MATKNNPGEFDCYTKAEPDEPMFVLLARDSTAPDLVRAWVEKRIASRKNLRTDAQIVEALECAGAMEAYAKDRALNAGPNTDDDGFLSELFIIEPVEGHPLRVHQYGEHALVEVGGRSLDIRLRVMETMSNSGWSFKTATWQGARNPLECWIFHKPLASTAAGRERVRKAMESFTPIELGK